MRDTVYALSSGSPPAAIAVVRISGPRADAALEALTGKRPEPRLAVLVTIREAGGEELDRALAVRFPGPHSATGEDLAELHLHGGRAVIAAVLAALGALEGLREAEPGEFTRRAFENGRIDLAEAEGLADLLAAETQSQRRNAQALAGGALSRQVEAWLQRLLALAAEVEAVLDFADEAEVDEAFPPRLAVEAAALANDIRAVLVRPPAERLRDGVRVVIAGPPNSGKSSLFNAIVGRDAAITSEIAGTTRDLVEAPMAIAGTPFVLIDTAGLRESSDVIEALGVERAQASLAAADLVLWLGPADQAPAGAFVVQSKSDIASRDLMADLAVSAKTGAGMDVLAHRLVARARTLLPPEGDVAVNARHRTHLTACVEALAEIATGSDLLIAAEALRAAQSALHRITGRAGVEEMFDALFARFCIGK